MCGIWVLDVISIPRLIKPAFWLGLALSCGLYLMSFRADLSRRLIFVLAAACVICFVAGMSRYHRILNIGPNHITRCLQSNRQLATLKGVVVSPIVNGQTNSSIPWLEAQSSFYLDAQFIQSDEQWIPICGTVRVQVAEPVSNVTPGNHVLIYCWLSRFLPPPNPGQFDLRCYMARNGVYVAASVPVREGVEIIDPSISQVHRIRSILYQFGEESLLDDCLGDRDVRNMASALVLGRREQLAPPVMAAFQKTNLAHFISLSGQHIGILAGSLWLVFRTIGLPKRPRAGLCILMIIIYALLVPPAPATNRAVFLSCFVFVSFFLHRRSSALNTLALSAIVLLLLRPSELFSPGWQLSFLSVLGILLFHERVVFYLRSWIFYPLAFFLRERFLTLQHFLRSMLDVMAVGISAWVAIAGLLFYYFGSINPISPLWTVLVMPFVVVLLYAGYLKLVIAKLLPSMGALLSFIIHYSAAFFEKSVLLLSKIDLFRITSRQPSVGTVLLIYAVVAAILFLPFIYRRTRLSLCFLCAFFFFQPVLHQFMLNLSDESVKMTCLSVGHGQAIVLSGPGNEHILFDAGSITVRDPGRKVVLPYLQQLGISCLDAVYISHGDLDHINGLPDIASFVKIKNLYANGEFLKSTEVPSVEQQVFRSLSDLAVEPQAVHEISVGAGLRIRSLWPTDASVIQPGLSENDKSEVFLIQYAGRNLLLCGDVELSAQQSIMLLYPELRADVLILPHHGSTVNLDEQFIRHLDPQTVIASCAWGRVENAWHPRKGSRIQAFHTGSDGAVTVKIKADGTVSAAGSLESN